MDSDDKYLVLLRRELTRAQARLKRVERERDRLQAENEQLKAALARTRRPSPTDAQDG